MASVDPTPASTVVVVRSAPSYEVLMVRRNDRVAFMAGAFVFPGGRVDPADFATDARTWCDGSDQLPGFPDLTAEQELPYRVAAIRELEEEAAVLLARDDGGLVPQHAASRVRAALHGTRDLAAAVMHEGLRLALDALQPLAHWVTPDVEGRRYDTRFFLALMPDGQCAQSDASETTALVWISPADAIERGRRGEITLPPPTWTTLRRLARFETVNALFASLRHIHIVRVQPVVVRLGDRTILTLPGDPGNPAPPGWEVPEETRFILEEGGAWRPMRAS
jgi:8-oxo-dGTP pyrophosphatase MutT (NUDIX family)